jgi:hypothetical protein
MSGQHREPLPVGPFVDWCRHRIEGIRAEIGADYVKGGSGNAADMNYLERLMREIGWDPHNGPRRLYRWMNPDRGDRHSGIVERAEIEDALHCAGVPFDEVYPDAAPPRLYQPRFGQSRRLTDAQVLAAHTIYVRERLVMTEVAELIWRQHGYASCGSCARSLVVAFQGLGLPTRRCEATTRAGVRCRKPPLSGRDVCTEHQAGIRPSHLGGATSGRRQTEQTYVLPEELVAHARVMYVQWGMSFRRVGEALVAQTPLSSADYLSQRLADVAAEQRWHRTRVVCKAVERVAA